MKIIVNEQSEVININDGDIYINTNLDGTEFEIKNETVARTIQNLSIDFNIITFLDLTYEVNTDEFSIKDNLTSEVLLDRIKQFNIDKTRDIYMNIIKWTDDYLVWYDKKVRTDLNSVEEDTEYQNVMDYWKESVLEYERCKTEILNSTTEAEIDLVVYNPIDYVE